MTREQYLATKNKRIEQNKEKREREREREREIKLEEDFIIKHLTTKILKVIELNYAY